MIKTFDFDFLQKTIAHLELYNMMDKKLGLAISGGEDSCVLLDHFLKIKNKRDISFSIIHVHHGLILDALTNDFRNSAQKFVQELALKNNIPFYTNPIVSNEDSSEENLRNIRLSFYDELKSAKKIDIIVTGHHQLDVLETRLIRLLRGSGPQGLAAMTAKDEDFFRPLLSWDKEFINEYVQKENLQVLVDPSNKDPKYFRNWIRHQLLPMLQDYRPGSVESLSRSLELIVDNLKGECIPDIISLNGIERSKLLVLPKSGQRSVVASYLQKLNVNNYSHTHVDEILKRLDSSQKELTFDLLGLKWTACASCVAASKS